MLKRCGGAGCDPVEQVRGELGPGDYYDVIINNPNRVPGAVPDAHLYGTPVREGEEVPEGVRQEHCVEISDANANDFRIVCRKCGKAVPWKPKDLPDMPDAGADWVRNSWNRQIT